MAREKETDRVVVSVRSDASSISSAALHALDDARLAELGYRSEFKREFSMLETIAFAFSIMGVVASVSSTLSFGLASGGHVGLVWGWFIPCIFVLAVAASLAELTSSMPTSAGLYYFSAKLAPPRWSALASWITGWANITGQVTLVCSIDYTCALMIATAITINTDGRVVLSAGATYGVLLAILLAHGIVCSAATRVLARLNLFYTVVNVGASLATIVALVVCSENTGDRVSSKVAWTQYENNTGWSNSAFLKQFTGGFAFLVSFTAPMWTLTGYDSAAHISEEVAGASRSAPIAIMVGVVGTEILGWGLYIAASYATADVGALLSSELPLPMGQLLFDVLGKRGMLAIWSFIIVVQFVTGAAQGVDASRAVFAFARDNALPGSRWLKQVNQRTRTPIYAVWFVIIGSGICGLLGFSTAALNSLAGAAVIGLYTSYATPIFLRVTSGRNRLVPGPFSLGRYYIPIGIVAFSWVAFIVVILLFPATSSPGETDMNYSIVIIGGVFILSSLTWVFSAHKWFTGPISNVIREDDDYGKEKEIKNEASSASNT